MRRVAATDATWTCGWRTQWAPEFLGVGQVGNLPRGRLLPWHNADTALAQSVSGGCPMSLVSEGSV